MVHSKLRPNPFAVVVPIEKKKVFDLDREISKLQIFLIKKEQALNDSVSNEQDKR